eukprot:scaffold80720_cov71-Phaeocystis_antarctica.AAC.5
MARRVKRHAPQADAQLGSRTPRSRAATALRHRPAAAPAGCAAPPRPASRALPPSAEHPRPHPCQAPLAPPPAPYRRRQLAVAQKSAHGRCAARWAWAEHCGERKRRELDKLVGAPAERVHAAEAVPWRCWRACHAGAPAEPAVGGGEAAADGGEVGGRVAYTCVEARGQRGVDGAHAAHAQREHGRRRARAVREDADGRAELGRVVQ